MKFVKYLFVLLFSLCVLIIGKGQERQGKSKVEVISNQDDSSVAIRNECLTTASFSITERSSSRALDDPFFDQGEEVRICIDYFVDFSDIGVSWVHGLIPDFGPGWDMSTFQPDSALISPNTPIAKWHDISDEDCYPSTSSYFDISGICTYVDSITGRLILCNTSCEFCPCTGALPKDTRLPSGWFWSQNGGAGCDNGCKPSTRYGMGVIIAQISICFDMKVRTFLSNAEIKNNTGLNINIQVTTDDQTGCWKDPQNPHYPIESKQFGPNWSIACSPSSSVIVGRDTIICNATSSQLSISNENPLDSNDIIVKTIFNDKVSGNRDHYYHDGRGVINDTLVNTTDDIQVVLYTVASVSDTNWCPIFQDIFRVIVYPTLSIQVDDIVLINYPVAILGSIEGNWIVSDTSIAIVSNGMLIGRSSGSVEISLFEPISKCTSDVKIVLVIPPTYILNVFTYTDNDGNGKYNSAIDSKLPNTSVFIPKLNNYYYTDTQGIVDIILDTGFFEIIYEQTTGDWIENQITSYLNVEELFQSDSIGFIPKLPKLTGKTIIPTSWLRCLSTVKLYNRVLNTSSRNMDAKLVVLLDSSTSAVSGVPTPFVQNTNRFEWVINGLRPNYYFDSHIFVNIPDAMSNMDTLHFYSFLISNEGDTISRFKSSDIIRCSYDPNDKRSWPDRIGEDNYTLRSERIDYTIRFQNNGNDTAFYVKIVDILDPSLDKKSLIVYGSSHEVNTFILGDTLVFEHNDIILPDTASNFIESQGFVSFSFTSLPDVPQGTVVFNKAEIIFDQNVPIITNQVKNTIVDALPCPLEAIWVIDNTINVNEEGSYYEWYECNTNILVSTTSVPTFIPEATGTYYAAITGDFCRTITDCVTLVISSSAQTESNTVKIFPNPNQGEFSIISKESIKSIIVRDNMGKEIQKYDYLDASDQRFVSISSLTSGMYFISVTTKYYNHLMKVIVR